MRGTEGAALTGGQDTATKLAHGEPVTAGGVLTAGATGYTSPQATIYAITGTANVGIVDTTTAPWTKAKSSNSFPPVSPGWGIGLGLAYSPPHPQLQNSPLNELS